MLTTPWPLKKMQHFFYVVFPWQGGQSYLDRFFPAFPLQSYLCTKYKALGHCKIIKLFGVGLHYIIFSTCCFAGFGQCLEVDFRAPDYITPHLFTPHFVCLVGRRREEYDMISSFSSQLFSVTFRCENGEKHKFLFIFLGFKTLAHKPGH